MMIKAGIVVSAAAATLLAVSPLAFAGDYDGGNGHHHKSSHSKSHDRDKDRDRDRDHRGNRGGDKSCTQDNSASSGRGRGGGGGLLDISNNTVQVPVQACNNNVLNNLVVGILSKNQSAESR